jgi:uncharacterized protein (TIGR02271 family)
MTADAASTSTAADAPYPRNETTRSGSTTCTEGNSMFEEHDARALIGAELYAATDQKVGRIGQVFLDDETGRPEWATVQTGWFGSGESFVPLQGAQRVSAGLAVPYAKEQIKEAPRIESSDGHLSRREEAALYQHYGFPYAQADDENAGPASSDTDLRARNDDALLRQEEELDVGKERVETGTVRLRKYVVTEEQNLTVPVRKEKARLESEPLTGEQQRLGDEIAEGESEVTLSEERPVVHKETVAKERVRLSKEVEEQEQSVSADVRKEQIEVEGEPDGPR